jgi:hypothetical protein
VLAAAIALWGGSGPQALCDLRTTTRAPNVWGPGKGSEAARQDAHRHRDRLSQLSPPGLGAYNRIF